MRTPRRPPNHQMDPRRDNVLRLRVGKCSMSTRTCVLLLWLLITCFHIIDVLSSTLSLFMLFVSSVYCVLLLLSYSSSHCLPSFVSTLLCYPSYYLLLRRGKDYSFATVLVLFLSIDIVFYYYYYFHHRYDMASCT